MRTPVPLTNRQIAVARQAAHHLLEHRPGEGDTRLSTDDFWRLSMSAQVFDAADERYAGQRRQLSASHAKQDDDGAPRYRMNVTRTITEDDAGKKTVKEQESPADYVYEDEPAYYAALDELAEKEVEVKLYPISIEAARATGASPTAIAALIGNAVAAPAGASETVLGEAGMSEAVHGDGAGRALPPAPPDLEPDFAPASIQTVVPPDDDEF